MDERAACCLTSDVGDLLLRVLTGDDGRGVELLDDGRDGAGMDACPAMHSVFGLVRPMFSQDTPFFARKKLRLTVLLDIFI